VKTDAGTLRQLEEEKASQNKAKKAPGFSLVTMKKENPPRGPDSYRDSGAQNKLK
jgi:hypothetical protein